MNKVINISRDFSRYPAGRFKTDGPWSGELFRDDYLIPALKEFSTVEIQLDGTRGYGSSFLEESFGGLIRIGYNKEELLHKINFTSSDQSLIDEILEYIEKAKTL